VFGTLGRRAVESVVIAFAVLGFGLVPLGSKTAFEHTLALIQTSQARDAARGLVSALGKAQDLLRRAVMPQAPDPAPVTEDALPLPSAGGAVRPVPPKLVSDPPKPRPHR
jgi:hypothetical protein